MAQVDFRPLIPPPENGGPSPDSSLYSTPEIEPLPRPELAQFKVRLTGAQWTNLAFVICAGLGALFSAAYLFRGGELFQEVAAWPRELFHGRAVQVASVDSVNNSPARDNLPPQSARQAIATRNDSGDPFSP